MVLFFLDLCGHLFEKTIISPIFKLIGSKCKFSSICLSRAGVPSLFVFFMRSSKLPSWDFDNSIVEYLISEFKKDSLNNIIDLSKLELAELYTLKYKNYKLGETVLTQYLSKDPNSNRATKAKYLLYKLYKIQNNEKYIKYTVDLKLLKKLWLGPKFAHWNNAEIGSHIKFYRNPNIFERNIYENMNYFHG